MKNQHLFTESVFEWSFGGPGCTELAEPMTRWWGESVNWAATELSG